MPYTNINHAIPELLSNVWLFIHPVLLTNWVLFKYTSMRCYTATFECFGKSPLSGNSGRSLTCNRLLELNHYNDCYIFDFFFYFCYCGAVCKSKSLYFFVL